MPPQGPAPYSPTSQKIINKALKKATKRKRKKEKKMWRKAKMPRHARLMQTKKPVPKEGKDEKTDEMEPGSSTDIQAIASPDNETSEVNHGAGSLLNRDDDLVTVMNQTVRTKAEKTKEKEDNDFSESDTDSSESHADSCKSSAPSRVYPDPETDDEGITCHCPDCVSRLVPAECVSPTKRFVPVECVFSEECVSPTERRRFLAEEIDAHYQEVFRCAGTGRESTVAAYEDMLERKIIDPRSIPFRVMGFSVTHSPPPHKNKHDR
jgi:hypothetical protein